MRKSLAFAAASLITVPAYADITYTLTPLGLPTQPGCTSNGETAPFPNSINDAGRVVGIYCGPQGTVRGFFWTPQQGAVDIGLPPDLPDNKATRVFPSNINNQMRLSEQFLVIPPISSPAIMPSRGLVAKA